MPLVGLLINAMPWVKLIHVFFVIFPSKPGNGNVYVKSETKSYCIVSRIDEVFVAEIKLDLSLFKERIKKNSLPVSA